MSRHEAARMPAMPAPDLSHRTLADLISLKGRQAVVTGGARGLGLAIARRLAEAGAGVFIGDLDEKEAARAAAGIAESFGVSAAGWKLDVTQSRSVADVADRAAAAGGLHIWVNNAGIYPVTPVLELSDAEWEQVNGVNLTGTFYGSREAARHMVGQGRGVIINIESMAAFRGRSGCAHYSASKHGVSGLTKSLAVELGPRGVRVLAIAPTLAETPGVHERRRAAAGAGGDIMQAMEAKVIATIPLGRTAAPDDIARVALFCASDLAAFVSGTTVFADGGHSAY
jgi:NAD(P)-dependent dehydrogenase (short-subunit alcohol dehydrogenase family)